VIVALWVNWVQFGCRLQEKLHGSHGTVVENVGMAISYLSLFSSGKVLLSVV
jgi:hypothetical protein